MPIIKSAKKQMRQNAVKRQRNNVFRRRLHDYQKEFNTLIKDGDAAGAEAKLSGVYKIIDTCAKKNLLHDNKAARLKSQAQKALSELKK